MNPPIVNLDQLSATRDLRHGEKFDALLAPVGALLGARKLGYNVTTVALVADGADVDYWHGE